jgi:O-antigen ligase
MKQASADGRLFIWRVSMDMVKEFPLYGKGADGFTANYMPAQAAYFEAHPNSDYIRQATDNVHAFNEYLRIVCEYGFVGLLLLAALLFFAFRTNSGLLPKGILLFLLQRISTQHQNRCNSN